MSSTSISVAAINGSLSKSSLNAKFIDALIAQAPGLVKVNKIDIRNLPVYNRDFDSDYPKAAIDFKSAVQPNDAFLFVTPEHNRSFTVAMKNAVDWGSHPYGKSVWSGKPAAVLGATMGIVGTFGAQNHLRQVLAAANVHVLTKPEFYFSAGDKMSESGEITNEDTRAIIDTFWSEFITLINRFKD